MFGVRRPAQPDDEGTTEGDSAGPADRPAAAGDKPDRAADGEAVPAVAKTHRTVRPSLKIVAIGTAAAAAIAAGVVYAVTQSSPAPGAQAAVSPIHVVALAPANQATGVDGANPIIVTFSGQLSASSATPTLTPSVPGSWTVAGESMEFVPATPFSQSTQVTIQIPGGRSGVRSTDGGLLSSTVTEQFTTGAYSQVGLAVLLSQLGYLPMTWVPQRSDPALAELTTADPAAQTPQGEAYAPPPGSFSWEPGYPSTLQALWSPDQANVLLQGAVMAFKSEHNMTIDGSLTPQLWTALFQAQEHGEMNTNGYTYAIANKGTPETLTIWHNGQQVLQSLANTGIGVAPTVDGTFPVYERFLNTIMSGTNPDGSHYSDPVSYVSYFNGGDAVHYFPRGSYGSPQSLGCVELPYTQAQQAYPFLTYGSLVSVVG